MDLDLLLDGAFDGGLFTGLEPSLLQEVAPVVAFPFESDRQWKEYNRFYADVVRGPDAAADLLTPYETRLAEVRAKLPAQRTVSLVRVRPDRVLNFSRNGFASVVFSDLSLATVDVEGELSLERLRDIDADAVYVFASENDPVDAEAAIERLTEEPIWQQLQAVQRGDATQ